MDIGICVRVENSCSSAGRFKLIAKHKRDASTTWKVCTMDSIDSNTDPIEVVKIWMDKFTGPESAGYLASYKIVARGSDHEGYYFVLAPTAYH